MTNSSATAVVLAAGEGRRLEPLTNRRPKPMVPVANEPLLEYVVEAIATADVDRIVLVVGYRQERIRNHFGDGDEWDVEIEYIEQGKQLGTGHAVLQAEPAVDGRFIVLNGDRIMDASVVRRVRDQTMNNDVPVMAITRSDSPSDYGVVSIESDRVTGIREKPTEPIETGLINAGVYGFDQSIFEEIRSTSTSGELAITETLDRLARDNSIATVRYRGRWLDVSNLWDLVSVNAALVGEQAGHTEGRAAVADDVVLGSDVRLGPNVTVSGGTSIGDNVTIGANVVVENSVIFPDAVLKAGSVVKDSIVAGNARIGPNATLVGGASTVVVGDRVHKDVELGGVVGDNAAIGGGATIDGGAIVGDDATIDAGVAVSGRIDTAAHVQRG